MVFEKQFIVAGGSCTIEHVESFISKVQQFAKNNHILIQLFNAEKIYGKNHLLSAAQHALRSEKEGRMTTNSVEMEIFLYASGERQIKLAIPKMGVTSGFNNIAVLFIIPSHSIKNEETLVNSFFSTLQIKRDDNVLNGDEKTLHLFGITDTEIQTVSKQKYDKLILEKIALIDIIK